jgi:hypothetical protein
VLRMRFFSRTPLISNGSRTGSVAIWKAPATGRLG